MSKKKSIVKIFIGLICVILYTSFFVGCSPNTEEPENNYPVAGIWHAQATWHEDNPYNYGGDTYKLDIWFDFREDGTLRNKRTLSLNGYTFSDSLSDWTIINLTWTVKDNIITLSSGKQYVIIEDEFNDTYPNPQMILRYKKIENN